MADDDERGTPNLTIGLSLLVVGLASMAIGFAADLATAQIAGIVVVLIGTYFVAASVSRR